MRAFSSSLYSLRLLLVPLPISSLTSDASVAEVAQDVPDDDSVGNVLGADIELSAPPLRGLICISNFLAIKIE